MDSSIVILILNNDIIDGLNENRYYWFSFMTVVKVLLIVINKVVTLHRQIYKSALGILVTLAAKEAAKYLKPYKDPHMNWLHVNSLNACVSFIIYHNI
jgi:hypothetical protein